MLEYLLKTIFIKEIFSLYSLHLDFMFMYLCLFTGCYRICFNVWIEN